jgi:hypothetical protein
MLNLAMLLETSARACPDRDAVVADGTECGSGEQGEICIRGTTR